MKITKTTEVTFKDVNEAARFVVWWTHPATAGPTPFASEFGRLHAEGDWDLKKAVASAAFQKIAEHASQQSYLRT